MDTLSKLDGWLTGTWTNQSIFSKTALTYAILLITACDCEVPLLYLSMTNQAA